MATQAQVSAAEHTAAGLPPARRGCPAEDASGRGARSGLRRTAHVLPGSPWVALTIGFLTQFGSWV